MLISRRRALIGASSALVFPRRAKAWTHGASTGQSFKTLPLGAGGLITGMSYHSDGTIFIRTDTYGGYIGSTTLGTAWQQIWSANSVPNSFLTNSANNGPGGLWAIAIDPQNSSNLWTQHFNGSIFNSTNKGGTWIWNSNFAAVDTQTGFGYRYVNSPNMAVDPNNSSLVLLGTVKNGLWITANGGTTWTQISTASIPVGTDGTFYVGITGICFDGAQVSLGVTQRIYCCSYFHGIYVSNDGGSTWTNLSGGAGQPATARYVTNAQVIGGVYWCCLDDGSIWNYTYSTSTWVNTKVASGANSYYGFAINPLNTSEITQARAQMFSNGSPNGSMLTSINGGGAFTMPSDTPGTAWVSTDIPWLAVAFGPSSSAGCFFDPSVNGRFWLNTGIGVFHTDSLPTGTTGTVTFTDQSQGIEQMVGIDVIWPPGAANPICACEDSPILVPNIGSANPYPTVTPFRFGRGNCLDFSWLSAGYVACMIDTESGVGSFLGVAINSNYGVGTWTAAGSITFPSNTAGGCVAISTSSNMVVVGGFASQSPQYTLNGGTTWNACSGLPASTSWGGINARQRLICADPLNAGYFYAVDPGGSGSYASIDGGATWTKIATTPVLSFGHPCLRAIPNAAGTQTDLWYSDCKGGSSGGVLLYVATSVANNPIVSVTFNSITGVTEVSRFNFGIAKTAGHYPTLIASLAQGGLFGFWRCDDILTSPTWTQFGTATFNSIGEPVSSSLPVNCQLDFTEQLCGNWNTYGGAAGVTNGSGGWYYG